MRSLWATSGTFLFGITFAMAQSQGHKAVEFTAKPPDNPPPVHAIARIEPASGSGVTGRAVFTVDGAKVRLELTVEGLSAGPHAVHLHENGDCSAADASSAGGHWNPSASQHGQWGQDPFHRGDIGNLVPGDNGTATLTMTTDLWKVGDGSAGDVVGRSIVVHAKEDDFKTQPTGNAGGRIGCGEIRFGD